jgi:hypothetical protein
VWPTLKLLLLMVKLQGQLKLICDMLGSVGTFEVKLQPFGKHVENVNLCHFSPWDLLHKDELVCVPFPSVRAVEMIGFVAENFKTGVNDFHRHATNIHVLKPILC